MLNRNSAINMHPSFLRERGVFVCGFLLPRMF